MKNRRDGMLEALLECASAVLRNDRFENTARSIFDTACRAIGATAGYVALLSESGDKDEVLFLEDGRLPSAVYPDLAMPIRGLHAQAYKTGRAVFENDFSKSHWFDYMPEGHVRVWNVMFAPLNVHGKTVGLMGLANKAGDFTDEDARFAEAFGCFAALALQHSATQRALRRSEKRVSELLHSVNDVMWSTDEHGTLLYVNRAVEELYGVPAKEFRRNATLWLEAVHPEDRPVTERKARALLDGRDFVCEYRIVRPDGTVRWVQDRSSPMCGEDGVLARVAGITTDITLRREAEASLHRELAVNAAFAAIGRELLENGISVRDLANSLLSHARSLTDSRHGYVSEIDPATGDNVGHTLTGMMGADCAVQGEDKRIAFPRGADGLYPSLWGHSLNTRKSFFTNEPGAHPGAKGLPAGHVPLDNFLSVPVAIGGELLGQIALANAARPYTHEDLRLIERLADMYALAIQRERTRHALMHSETRYRAVMEQAGDAICLLDLNGRLMDVNHSACAVLGYERDDMLRLGIRDIAPQMRGVDDFAAGLDTGRTRKFETAHRRRDGSEFPAEVSASEILIRSQRYILWAARDATRRKEQERERALLEQRLKSLWSVARLVDADLKTLCTATLDELVSITGSRYGFYGFMQDGGGALEVHAWSPDTMADCAVTGEPRIFPVAEGGVWADAVRKREPVIINRLDETGRNRFPQGHVPVTRLLVVPVMAGDKVAAVAAVANKSEDYTAEDIEQIRAFTANVQIVIGKKRTDEEMASLREQLIQAQKMEAIGRMAGGMAHDFNNMLAVILGNASLALDELSPDAPHYEEFHEISSAAQRSRELTHKLLTFARKDKLNPRTVAPAAILDGIIGMLRRSIPKNVAIHTDYHHDLEPITVDATQLEQALLNVCANACDAMPDGGVLYIGARNRFLARGAAQDSAPGRFCEIIIRDSGTGIPDKIAGKIFEPFFTTKGVGQGTGLGLAITHGIIASHGGAINAENAPEGGARFSIILPAARGEAGAAEDARGKAAAPDRGSETVLVVDDEPSVLALAGKILSRAGYHVVTAGNGSDAVEIVRSAPHAVAVIVLDMVMPGMDGVQVFHAVRAARPDMPVILSSGYSREGAAENLLKAGAAAFTQKPYTTQELCRVVREVCDRNAPRVNGVSRSSE